MINQDLQKLSDQDLLKQFQTVAFLEKKATATVVKHLAEIYRRRLYAQAGYSSLFVYLKEKYNYSGSAAYRRIQAAKLSLQFSEIIDHLRCGKLNLTSISLIEPHMKSTHGKELIEKALWKTKEEIEYFLSNLSPRESLPSHRDKIRRLPVIRQKIQAAVSAGLDLTAPDHKKGEVKMPIPFLVDTPKDPIQTNLAQSKSPTPLFEKHKTIEIRKVKIEFVADETVARKIERAKTVLSHKYPKGALEDIIHQALEDLLEKRDPERKFARRMNAPFLRANV